MMYRIKQVKAINPKSNRKSTNLAKALFFIQMFKVLFSTTASPCTNTAKGRGNIKERFKLQLTNFT